MLAKQGTIIDGLPCAKGKPLLDDRGWKTAAEKSLVEVKHLVAPTVLETLTLLMDRHYYE